MTDPIAMFSRHIATTSFSDFPKQTVATSQNFILDTIGVGILGSSGPWVKELINAMGYPKVKGVARVIGSDALLSPSAAALCNAYQMHNSEFDCFHEGAVVHPVTCVLSASLAEIDRLYFEKNSIVSGKELIKAVVLGIDIACALGAACKEGLRFFRPGTCGAFGATAAIGSLRSFNQAKLNNAFSIVFSQLCGTMQAHSEGSPLLGMQMGFNARNAITACDLASQGIEGPKNILEGPFGYFSMYEGDYDLSMVSPKLGKSWCVDEISHKPFPSGRASHGIIDACLKIRQHADFNIPNIKSIQASIPPLVKHLVGRPIKSNMEINYARLCAQFLAARALITGNLTIDDFSIKNLNDQKTLALAKKTFIQVDNNPDPNTLTPLILEIEYNNGHIIKETVINVLGHPSNPLPRNLWIEKFQKNWQTSEVEMDHEICKNMIKSLENLKNETNVINVINNLFCK